jgi:hypothetical protein
VSGQRFGDVLRSHRERLQLTQEDLAQRAALGVRTVRELEASRVLRPRGHSLRLLPSEYNRRRVIGWVRRGQSSCLGTRTRTRAPNNGRPRLPCSSGAELKLRQAPYPNCSSIAVLAHGVVVGQLVLKL